MSNNISDSELRAQLKKYGVSVGPISGTTRSVYLKKLEKLKNGSPSSPRKEEAPSRKRQRMSDIGIFKKENSTSSTAEKHRSHLKDAAPSSQPNPTNRPLISDFGLSSEKENPSSSIANRYRSGLADVAPPSQENSSSRSRLSAFGISSKNAETLNSSTADRYRSRLTEQTPSSQASWSTRARISDFGTSFKENQDSSTTDWYRSRLRDVAPPTEENLGNRPRLSEVGTSLKRESLNSSAADWYRSRLHDVGNWSSASWTTGGYGNRRRWWQLNANTSRWLLYIFGGFLVLLIAMYGVIMNKNRVRFLAVLFAGATVDTVYFVYNHLILPALIILLIAGLVFGAYWYKRYKWHKAAEEQQQIFDMVEKILALLKKHYEECLLDNNRQPYLAVPHVRDMLIPPGKKKQLLPVWEKAVQYLNENESRVRTENQIISGEEFMVWRWLQISGANVDDKLWQGHAFPKEQAVLNAPPTPFSECLKLRGLFDPDLEEDDDWPEHIQDAILEKLGQNIRVMHVAIDTESKEGCVYMKLGSKEEAGAAYQLLNGSWFNRGMVSVKYLRVERYHERFPEAQRCLFPLRIKKPRYSVPG